MLGIMKDLYMVDCSKKNLIEFCTRKEMNYLPLLELDIFGNRFGYYERFENSLFMSWLNRKFEIGPIQGNKIFKKERNLKKVLRDLALFIEQIIFIFCLLNLF